MTCTACANPNGGLLIAGCRSCALRDIARGPEFFASMSAGKLTPAYAARLQALGEVEATHAEVKALAKTLLMGSVNA